MDRVYIFFELTGRKVISAPLSVRKSETSQDFRRIGVTFKCLYGLKLVQAEAYFVSDSQY